jgi:hypothetical protein
MKEAPERSVDSVRETREPTTISDHVASVTTCHTKLLRTQNTGTHRVLIY